MAGSTKEAAVADTPRQTDLERNPFAVLGASLRDSEQRIVELETARSAGKDADAVILASSTLRAPRTRLRAEMGWLPGLAPQAAAALLEQLRVSPQSLQPDPAWPPLAQANLCAAMLQSQAQLQDGDVVRWITGLGEATQAFSRPHIMRQINDDRTAARIPPVRSEEPIEAEIKVRHEVYVSATLARLDSMTSTALCAAMTQVAAQMSGQGTRAAPALIYELAGQYETRALAALEKGATAVRSVLAELASALWTGEAAAQMVVGEIGQVLAMWTRIARPMQLLGRSRGQRHPLTHELAAKIHGALVSSRESSPATAQRLTRLMQEHFGDLPEWMDRIRQ
jgi:hypothetical protein